MTRLQPEHPDYECKPGDKRMSGNTEYTFGQNQYTSFWRAGPKDGTVNCSMDYPHATSNPYKADGVTCSDFDRATARAKSGAKREYERAVEIVARYEGKEG